MSCLIIVERGVSEKNNIAALTIDRGIKSWLESLAGTLNKDQMKDELSNLNLPTKNVDIAVHGVSHEISLTSVLLGTLLDREEIPFSVVDSDGVLDRYGEYIKRVLNEVSLVLISTTYTMGIKTVQEIVQFIRSNTEQSKPGVKIALGGQSLSAWLNNDFISDKLFEYFNQVDYMFFGESDTSLGVIVSKILKKENLGGIKGLTYKSSDVFKGSRERVFVNAEDIASPDWGILNRYNFNNLGYQCETEAVGIEEGRGCMFRCSFCSYSAEVPFRRKNSKAIINELENIYENSIKQVSFLGAEFFNPKKFSEPVLKKIGQLSFPLDIWAFGRLDIIADNPHFADLLKKANFSTIQFGMESGSPEILNNMNKKMKPERITMGCRLVQERGIKVKASIIIGFPGETKETLHETKQILKECNFEEIMLHGLVVLPGTPLYKNREKFGIKLTPNGWAHKTMGVTDIPAHLQDMIIFLTENTSTYVLNIAQNITPKFFRSKASEARIRDLTFLIQKILSIHWKDNEDGNVSTDDHLFLYEEFLKQIDRMPTEYIPN